MEQMTAEADLIPERIRAFARLSPDSIAVASQARNLTYRELYSTACSYCKVLTEFNVRANSVVAICLERSCEWIAAALGTMLSRAAYVPLDANWPDSRLSYAVKDSGASVLIATPSLAKRLDCGIPTIDPGRIIADTNESRCAFTPKVVPQDLAYIVYTSGSTGVPKGVEITHGSLAHVAAWHRSNFEVSRKDRVSHLLGLGFDAAELEIWAHLTAGSTLSIPSQADSSTPESIHSWLLRDGVTITVVPAIIAMRLMELKWPQKCPLRLLVAGGDILHFGPSREIPFRVANNYGPSECTIVSTWAMLEPGSQEAPPIGKAIDGVAIYLLDEEGKQVPQGAIGEVYIGGKGVGRGYRNLPQLSSQVFLPDPFSPISGARMYRTGDRASQRPDGNLVFHGRVDRQVKIRGNRVELDEIASVLMRHPNVAFAVTTKSSEVAGSSHLSAYVLCEGGIPTIRELQDHLRRSLPDYMIPSEFKLLRTIPLSPNGKLNCSDLSSQSEPWPREEDGPLTPTEEKLLAIMREILGNDSIGVKSDFLLAGGHSLLGMQLIMRVRSFFGVELGLQQLFETGTVEALAEVVEQAVIESIESMTDVEAQAQLEKLEI
ncbi:MAG TPA: non-ribosomal peptide synthetase [Terracidiphilus sp.]|nr:non-ribosomal peptide synthetase [Terracidiphilus sp.]